MRAGGSLHLAVAPAKVSVEGSQFRVLGLKIEVPVREAGSLHQTCHPKQAVKVGKKGPSGVKQAAGQMKSANDYAFDEDGEPGARKPGNSES